MNGIHEVTGSTPVWSTILCSTLARPIPRASTPVNAATTPTRSIGSSALSRLLVIHGDQDKTNPIAASQIFDFLDKHRK